DYIDINRIDNDFTIGGGISYQLSRNIRSQLDLKYRDRDSTLDSASYEEWSVYASLTYGFGQPLRR
ncbi:MAG: outer membrane beta-barrel protein, partial [Thiogranum sp.]